MSLRSILSQLFPFLSICSICQLEYDGQYSFCPDCHRQFTVLGWACRVCANPLPSEDALLCPDCLKEPPYFEKVICKYAYTPPLKPLVLDFKYHHAIWHKHGLAALMCEQQEGLDDADWLLPVPSHNRRLRERGYNQAWLLAKILSKTTNIPMLKNAIIRQTARTSQVGLSKRLRARNAEDAFLCLEKQNVYGHIVIVDDLLTTGHTANSLARVLKSAGASKVSVWALARAIPHHHNPVRRPT